MIRRTFLKAFGGAIIGTVIALKIPDSIAPTIEKFKEDFHNLTLTHKNKKRHWVSQLQKDYAHELYC